MLNDLHVQQLEARGLDPELAARYGWHTQSSRDTEWLVIPYVHGTDVVNRKYRTLGENKKFRMDPSARLLLWNLNAVADATLKGQPLVITEGEMDALAAIQSGFLRTVSVPNGAPNIKGEPGERYAFLDDLAAHLSPDEIVILATDSDGPGSVLREEMALVLGPARCKFLIHPLNNETGKRLKDLNEVLQLYGTKGVVETIQRAQFRDIKALRSMDQIPDIPDKAQFRLEGPLADLIRVRPGDFWVISATPGSGKSTFVDDIICQLAWKHGVRTAIASFEKSPKPEHQKALRTWHIGMHRGRPPRWDIFTAEEKAAADKWIESSFRFIVHDLADIDEEPTLDWFLDTAAAAVTRDGCRVIVLDPWNELSHSRSRDQSLTEYVGDSIKRLKRFASRYSVCVIVVAHPAKMRADEELSLYTISDSAHWANKADVGVLLRRDALDNTEVEVAKVRYESIGQRGSVSARFNSTWRFFKTVEDPIDADI